MSRKKVAVLTLVFFSLMCTVLTFQHLEQQRRQMPGALDYLLDQNSQQLVDPLGIADDERLTCIGTSSNGRIIGYTIDAPLAQASIEIDTRMRQLGWALMSDSGQGVMTYSNDGCALVLCSECGNSTSVVVELT